MVEGKLLAGRLYIYDDNHLFRPMIAHNSCMSSCLIASMVVFLGINLLYGRHELDRIIEFPLPPSLIPFFPLSVCVSVSVSSLCMFILSKQSNGLTSKLPKYLRLDSTTSDGQIESRQHISVIIVLACHDVRPSLVLHALQFLM